MNITQEIGGLETSMSKNLKRQSLEENKPQENKEPVKTSNRNLNSQAPNKRVSYNDVMATSHRNKLSDSAKHSMKTRILSAIVGLAIVVPALFLGGWIYFALMTFALAIATWEILGCASKRRPIIYLIYFLFLALITYWPIFTTMVKDGLVFSRVENYFGSLYLSIIVIAFGIFLLFLLTVIYKDFSVMDACFLLSMGILIGFGFQCLYFLRYYPYNLFGLNSGVFEFNVENTIKPSLLLIYVIVATFATDTGAYFVGVFFGKNRMNERISPKKTWEGFVGGILVSFILSSVIGIVFAACSYPILPTLDLNHWYLILIISAIIPLFATLGDFVFSSIKSYWGIKDYGKLIPGHGGVLDRLDSIFFAAIISAIFVFMLSSINNGTLDWSKFLV